MRVCVFSAKKVTGGAAIDRLGKARLPIHGEGKRGGEGRERNRAHVAPVTVEKRGGRKGGGARVSFGPPPSTPPPPHFPLKLARGVKQAARLPRFLPFSLAHSLEPKALAREPQVDERHSDRERRRGKGGREKKAAAFLPAPGQGSLLPDSARNPFCGSSRTLNRTRRNSPVRVCAFPLSLRRQTGASQPPRASETVKRTTAPPSQRRYLYLTQSRRLGALTRPTRFVYLFYLRTVTRLEREHMDSRRTIPICPADRKIC